MTSDNNKAPKQRRRGRPKGLLNKKSSKRQKKQSEINDEFVAAFGEASEVRELKQNDSDCGEEPDFHTNILNSRHDDDDNEVLDSTKDGEDTDDVPVDFNMM